MAHSFLYYEQAFRTLHTNMQHGKPAPHKAFLLLAVMDMIEEGLITSPHINLTDQPVKVSIMDDKKMNSFALIGLMLGVLVA